MLCPPVATSEGVTTAVVSAVMTTYSVHGDGGIILLWPLHHFSDSKAILTKININHGVFLEPKCAGGYIKVNVVCPLLLFCWDRTLAGKLFAKSIY